MVFSKISRFFALALLLFVAPAYALDRIYTSFFSNTALSGYDPVAYFTVGKPTKGDSDFEFEYKGATWQFASDANRQAFIKAPDKYAPAYGGYCAWAVAQGKDAPGDPLYWKLVDGKLYLNYSADIQKKWNANMSAFIKTADQTWPKLLQP